MFSSIFSPFPTALVHVWPSSRALDLPALFVAVVNMINLLASGKPRSPMLHLSN